MMGILKRVARKILFPPLHKVEVSTSFLKLGDRYASFPLLQDTKPGALVYSFGVGEDISFELAAIEKFNCEVHAFDPTPRSIEWLKSQLLPDGMKFHQIGIGGHDGEVEFFPPENPDDVSFAVNPIADQGANPPTKSKVMRLESIIEYLETDVPDALRMNVEGFEYSFIEDFVQSVIRPHQLVIEFHHGMYGIGKQRTLDAVRGLQKIGYRIFYISGHGRDYGFVHRK